MTSTRDTEGFGVEVKDPLLYPLLLSLHITAIIIRFTTAVKDIQVQCFQMSKEKFE